jgi:hypothetical protein
MTTLTYAVMLRRKGDAGFVPAGHVTLEAAPLRGASFEFAHERCTVHGTVEQLFIPPGCEENCVGTLFVAER